ncbi:hypothetical protein QD712_30215 [Streptomyces acidiscabies]|uniref:hypothetical protein n=1 Tax=Streptomyces acidiscabies TaxID=42234 RepID=UPI0030CC463B
MVRPGLAAGGDAGLPPAAHQEHRSILTLLAPNEGVTGAKAVTALLALRADPSALAVRHPNLVFRPAPERLAHWRTSGVATDVFDGGHETVRHRYTELGLSQLLPLSRVLVGAESASPGTFGGFHHPDQGYRHLQMVSVITMYGPLETAAPQHPELALLDLLRAYAHDCLHYGSRRQYVDVGGRPTRTQYGINFRHFSGRSYSAADSRDTSGTRNIGVVMEGACDREARRITRETAERAGLHEPADPMGRLAFRDCTGTLTPEDAAPGVRYADALHRYESGVNLKYAEFLTEFGLGEEEELHVHLLRAMISGDVQRLSAWLDARHGPGTFPGIFLSGTYFAPDRLRGES